MNGGLSEQDKIFLKYAQEQGFLGQDRAFMLEQERAFYPDMDMGQIALTKGLLDEEQVRQILRFVAGAGKSGEAAPPQADASAPQAPPAAPPPQPTVAPQPVTPATPSPPPKPASPREPEPVRGDVLADPSVKSFTRLEEFLGFARTKGASDLHLSTGYAPYLRLHGRFQFLDREALRAEDSEGLIYGLLRDDQRKTLEEKLNLECSLDIDGQGRYRTTVIRQQNGWDATFHVVNSEVPGLEALGLPRSVMSLADYRQGMILITGPSGSGKTTTMAAMVEHVNAGRAEHILTLEKPIEYVFEPKKAQINQREVGVHTESYQRALRAALREDPDVIMLGEMRDLETISLAITAAETGHLIFGTLNTTTAARTITRILDSYPPDQQPQIRTMIAESLRGIICQQLAPRKSGEGVALAIEVLVVTPGISSLIREMKIHQVASAIQTGKRVGMIRMDESLMNLLRSNEIDPEEAYARAEDKRTFEPFLNA